MSLWRGGLGVARAAIVVVGAVAAAVATGVGLVDVLPPAYVVLVFVIAVLVVAIVAGPRAGLAAAVASFLAFNFFFVEPRYTFVVADRKEVFALVVFLIVAVATGGLAGRLRETADAANRRADTLALLHDFAERVAATADVEIVRKLIVRRVGEHIRGTAVLFDRGEAAAGRGEAWPAMPDVSSEDRRAVERVFESGRALPAAAPGYPERRFEFRPLATGHGVVAVVGLAPENGARLIDGDAEQGLAALLDHAATALERARFAEETAAAEEAAERERLRSALLSSISHDLRTPLATILGSVTSLRQLGDRMDPADRDDLLAAIEEETDRLSRFVADLLALTRLEAGLDPRRDWVDVGDVARAAVAHLRRLHPDRAVDLDVDVAAPLPPVRSDATLLEQVLFNLGDNAAKASRPGEPIVVRVDRAEGTLRVAIADRGRGLSAEEIDRLFVRPEPRAPHLSPTTSGGLGLAVARRVIGAMNGRIEAESPAAEGHGTRVTIRLPVDRDASAIVEGSDP